MSDPFQPTRRGVLGALSGASIAGISNGRTASDFNQALQGSGVDSPDLGKTGAVVRTATQALPASVSARSASKSDLTNFDAAIGTMAHGGPIEITADVNLTGDRVFGPARGNIHAYDYAAIGNDHITRNNGLAGGKAEGWALENFTPRAPGISHTAGAPATAKQMVNIHPFTVYLITISVTSTARGKVAFRFGKVAVPSQGEGFELAIGEQAHSFAAFTSDEFGAVAFEAVFDTAWSGLVKSLSVTRVEREFPYDVFSIPNDRIDFANPMGIKFGRFMSGNISIGDRMTGTMLSKKAAWNVAIGNRALSSATDGIENTAIGTFALEYNQADQNTAGGYSALRFNTIGLRNTSWGYKALFRNSSGSDNSGVGYWAGFYNETGNSNASFGSKAAYYNGSGSFNAAFGAQSGLQNDGGSFNTFFGAVAGPYTPQPRKFSYDRTTCLGAESKGYGNNTLAIGYQARCGSDPYVGGTAVTTTAIAIGYRAVAEAEGSIALGGDAVAAGIGSITIGEGAGHNLAGNHTISIGLGANTFPIPVSYGNAIAIGNGATNTRSNQIVLGDGNITEIRAAVSSLTSISDRRDKTNVSPINGRFAANFLKTLRPSRWDWQMRDHPMRQGDDIGFIAQDVIAAQLEQDAMWLNIANQNNPDRLEITQGKLIPILVSALQDALSRIEAMERDRRLSNSL
jgi:hypothetical protein